MDKHKFLLLEALRFGAGHPDGTRLYRSGKLAGLFAGRTGAHAAVAESALRDGFLEMVKVERRGKTAVEWVRVTPRGLEYLLHNDSPVRALEDLRSVLDAQRQGLPGWIADLRQQIDGLERRLSAEVEAIGARLDRLSARALEAIQRLEQGRDADVSSVPWARQALTHLEEREAAGLGAACALGDLFAALNGGEAALTLKDFHAGLRRLAERGLVRLLPDEGAGPPRAPEYGLLDGNGVYHRVARSA